MYVALRSLSNPERQQRFCSRSQRAASTSAKTTSSRETARNCQANRHECKNKSDLVHFSARIVKFLFKERRVSSALTPFSMPVDTSPRMNFAASTRTMAWPRNIASIWCSIAERFADSMAAKADVNGSWFGSWSENASSMAVCQGNQLASAHIINNVRKSPANNTCRPNCMHFFISVRTEVENKKC